MRFATGWSSVGSRRSACQARATARPTSWRPMPRRKVALRTAARSWWWSDSNASRDVDTAGRGALHLAPFFLPGWCAAPRRGELANALDARLPVHAVEWLDVKTGEDVIVQAAQVDIDVVGM